MRLEHSSWTQLPQPLADHAWRASVDFETPEPGEVTGPPVELLCVEVAAHRCGLPVEAVVEIHLAVKLVPLPDAPDIVVGLVNRRGRPLPVVDLRRRVGLPSRPVGVTDHLVVMQLPDRQLAVLVDSAVDVVAVPANAVDEAVARSTDAVLSQGVAVLADGLLVVLDATKFISTIEASLLDELLAERSVTSR